MLRFILNVLALTIRNGSIGATKLLLSGYPALAWVEFARSPVAIIPFVLIFIFIPMQQAWIVAVLAFIAMFVLNIVIISIYRYSARNRYNNRHSFNASKGLYEMRNT